MKKRTKIIITILVIFALIVLLLFIGVWSIFKKTPEETLDIYNPVYLGQDTDQNEKKVEVGKGKNGQEANQLLLDWYSSYEEAKVYKVTDNVYAAIGYGNSNTIMIEGDEGLTLINSGDSIEKAEEELKAFRKFSDKPVHTIVYTSYSEAYGTQVYIDEEQNENIKIIAKKGHEEYIENLINEEAEIHYIRETEKSGELLDSEGEYAALESYASKEKTIGYVKPTELIDADETYSFNADGVEIQLIPTSAGDNDNLLVWLPNEKVCISNLVTPGFPELFDLKGVSYQDPKEWIEGVNQIIDLDPKYLIGIQGLPLTEEDDIEQELTTYRDTIQFVYNETIRFMNKNYSPDKIVQCVDLPEELTRGKLAGEFISEIDHNIRQIYNGIIGWFGTDSIELHPVTDQFEAERIVEGYGGIDAVIAESKEALEAKEYAWTVQLISYALEVDSDNEDAKTIKADALRELAKVTPSSSTRNYYLSEAAILEGTASVDGNGFLSKEKLMISSKDAYLKVLKVSIDPEKAGDLSLKVAFDFNDGSTTYGFYVHDGMAIISENPVESDLTINVDYEDFCDIAVGNITLQSALDNGTVNINGDQELFQKFISIFDL